MPNSLNFLSPKRLASLRCPLILASSEDAAPRVHRREVAEESGRGAPLGDLNEHPLFLLFFFFFFCNGLNVAALLLPHFSIVAPIWPLLFFLLFPHWPKYGCLDIYHRVTNVAPSIFMRFNFL